MSKEKEVTELINHLCRKESQTHIGGCCASVSSQSCSDRASIEGSVSTVFVLLNNENEFEQFLLSASSNTLNVSISTPQAITKDNNGNIVQLSSLHAGMAGGTTSNEDHEDQNKQEEIELTNCTLAYKNSVDTVSSTMYSHLTQDKTKLYTDVNSDPELRSQSWINVCRICYGTESFEELIDPCKCRGSIAFAHQSCLERWLRESSRSRCELCKFRYHIIRTPRYSILKGILIWLFIPAEHTKELFSDILGFCLYTPAALVATYLLLISCESVRQLLIMRKSFVANLMAFIAISGMASIDFAYSTWLILRIRKHVESWQRWWSNNCHLTLIVPEEDETLANILRKSVDTVILTQ